MRYLILIFFLFNCYYASSQLYYVGVTESYVRQKVKYTITTSPDTVASKCLNWYDPDLGVYKICFTNDKSTLVSIIPKSHLAVNYLVADFNETLLKVSETEWKYYKEGQVLKVTYIGLKNPDTSESVSAFIVTNATQ